MNATTKDGVVVMVGQVWRNLDYRMKGQKKKVVAVDAEHATMLGVHGHGPKTRVAIRRMHKHSTGWALVEDDTPNAV